MSYLCLFFFNDTATTEIYTLSLHDALPICIPKILIPTTFGTGAEMTTYAVISFNHKKKLLQDEAFLADAAIIRSEEHTSELQSRQYLVCRLLLEKKKNIQANINTSLYFDQS